MDILWWGGVDPERGPFVSFRIRTDILEYETTKRFPDLFDDPAVFWKVIEKMTNEEVPEGWELAKSLQQDVTEKAIKQLDDYILYGILPK